MIKITDFETKDLEFWFCQVSNYVELDKVYMTLGFSFFICKLG